MHSNLLINTILSLSNLLFLLLYVTLCFHNRLAIDDFHFLSTVNEHGIITGTLIEYNSWSSRWISVLLNHFILLINKNTPIGLPVFGIFNLLLFISVGFFFFKNLFQPSSTPYFNLPQQKNKLTKYWLFTNLSTFLISIIFISTIKIDETWFWLCSSTTYLWSNIMVLIGIACLLMRKKNTTLTLIGYFSFFYIGGSSGPLAIVSLLILLTTIVLAYFKNIPFKINRAIIIKRSFLSFFFCLASFLVLFFAEGNRIREQFFQEISIGYSFILNIKMVGIILIKRLPSILPFIAILCLPMISFGNYFKNSKADLKWKKKISYITFIYFSLIYIFQLPITYKTQDVGAFRALFFVTILTVSFFLLAYYIIGRNTSFNKRSYTYITIIPFLVSLSIFGYEFINQNTITSEYANAYDRRMIYIKSNDNNIELLELAPLPPSGMLFSAELSSDTSHFSNQHLKKALKLNFNIKKQTMVNNK